MMDNVKRETREESASFGRGIVDWIPPRAAWGERDDACSQVQADLAGG